jgi:histone-lysine N-methyltransferase SETD2
MPALYGGVQADQANALWQNETELINTNIYLSRAEKPPPKGDDIEECDCRERDYTSKNTSICTDGDRCFNRQVFQECVRCAKTCGNQRLKKGMWAITEVRPAGGKGWGLYLMEDVKAKDLIGM